MNPSTYAFLSIKFSKGKKKADVVKHQKAYNHVGLLYNWSPGCAGMPFIQSSDDCDLFNLRKPSGSAIRLMLGRALADGKHNSVFSQSRSPFVRPSLQSTWYCATPGVTILPGNESGRLNLAASSPWWRYSDTFLLPGKLVTPATLDLQIYFAFGDPRH